jgi:hypothetical protein
LNQIKFFTGILNILILNTTNNKILIIKANIAEIGKEIA